MSSPEEPKVQLANAYLLLPHIQNIQASHTLVQYTFQGGNLSLFNHKRFLTSGWWDERNISKKSNVLMTAGEKLQDTGLL